jgi:uncharacterized RDD family membrane protein YckC
MTEVVTGEAVVLDVPCARFPSRMIAIIIDMVVQIILIVVILAVLLGTTHLNAAWLAAVAVVTLILVLIGYPTAFETLSRGRSLGKMALGLRVVGDDGGPVRFRQSLWRSGAALIEIWALTGAPALICSLLSAKGKRLGDLFAGTFVIQERLPRRPGLPAALAVVPPPLAGWAQALELSGLSDESAERASSYLRRFYELTPMAREEFGQRIAADVAAQVTPPPPPGTPPAAFLAAVVAVRRQRETARLAAMHASAAGSGYGWPPAQVGPGAPPAGFYPAAPTSPDPAAPAGPYAAVPTGPNPAAPAGPHPSPAPAPSVPGEPAPTVPARQEPPGRGGFAPPV